MNVLLRAAITAGFVATGLPVQAVTLPTASFHGGDHGPLDLFIDLDWDDDGADIDVEVTQEDVVTTESAPISISTFFTLGTTLSVDGLSTGNVSVDLFNPYARFGIEASTPPNPDAAWSATGTLGIFGNLEDIDRSYAFLSAEIETRYRLSIFYEMRYVFADQEFEDDTQVYLIGICFPVNNLSGPSPSLSSGETLNCEFDRGGIETTTSRVPLPASGAALAGGLAFAGGLAGWHRRRRG